MQASRDLGLHVSSKLSGDWSAGNVTNLLSEPVLEHLLSRWESLDPLVRARLLLSPLFLRKKDLTAMQPELRQLAEAGCGDRDEWVRVLGRAVGPYDGKLHLDAVLKDSKLVGKTLNELRQLLEAADPAAFRPLEELYLNPDVRESLAGPSPSAPQHQHFRARKASEAPSARQPGVAAAPQRPGAASTAAQLAGTTHWAPRTSRPASAGAQADLFLPSKPVQRLGSGLGGAASGPLFVGSSSAARGGGGGGAAAAKPKRPAILDPLEVKRMNEAAAQERERRAAEQRAAKEAEARQRAEQRAVERAAEKAARVELKRKRSGPPGTVGEQPSSKAPRTTDDAEASAPAALTEQQSQEQPTQQQQQQQEQQQVQEAQEQQHQPEDAAAAAAPAAAPQSAPPPPVMDSAQILLQAAAAAAAAAAQGWQPQLALQGLAPGDPFLQHFQQQQGQQDEGTGQQK